MYKWSNFGQPVFLRLQWPAMVSCESCFLPLDFSEFYISSLLKNMYDCLIPYMFGCMRVFIHISYRFMQWLMIIYFVSSFIVIFECVYLLSFASATLPAGPRLFSLLLQVFNFISVQCRDRFDVAIAMPLTYLFI